MATPQLTPSFQAAAEKKRCKQERVLAKQKKELERRIGDKELPERIKLVSKIVDQMKGGNAPKAQTDMYWRMLNDLIRQTEGLVTVGSKTRVVQQGQYRGARWVSEVALPDSVRRIDAEAFLDCSNLVKARLSRSLADLGARAFRGCNRLAEVRLGHAAALTTIADSTFRDCSALRRVELPPGLTDVEQHAFDGCRELRHVDFPAGLRHVGKCAFRLCVQLDHMVLHPAIVSLGASAFEDCSALIEVVLPPRLTKLAVGGNCFRRCRGLTHALAPQAIVDAPGNIFKGCPRLDDGHCDGSRDRHGNVVGLAAVGTVRQLRWHHWHQTMHAWCAPSRRECVLTVLLLEGRLDATDLTLPSLPHDVWLYMLQFVRRCDFGR